MNVTCNQATLIRYKYKYIVEHLVDILNVSNKSFHFPSLSLNYVAHISSYFYRFLNQLTPLESVKCLLHRFHGD